LTVIQLSAMALRRHMSQFSMAQLNTTAARGLMTAAPVQAAADVPGSRDRETADEQTFKRPFHCIKTNELPLWPRTTGARCSLAGRSSLDFPKP
jgi:hypothetical protein